jgi:hypothetical protein
VTKIIHISRMELPKSPSALSTSRFSVAGTGSLFTLLCAWFPLALTDAVERTFIERAAFVWRPKSPGPFSETAPASLTALALRPIISVLWFLF